MDKKECPQKESKSGTDLEEKCHSNPINCGAKHGAVNGFLGGVSIIGVLYLADYFSMISSAVEKDAVFYNIIDNKILFTGLSTAFLTSIGLFAGTIKDYFRGEQK